MTRSRRHVDVTLHACFRRVAGASSHCDLYVTHQGNTMTPDIYAFVPGTSVHITGVVDGPLAGLTFAAKDLFDVAGYQAGGGNPDWAAYNPVPTRYAWAVQARRDAGATLISKTMTDEVSLGISGAHPLPRRPWRLDRRTAGEYPRRNG